MKSENVTTGRACGCGRPQPPTKKHRTAGPSNQDPAETWAALGGLFKVIELPFIPNAPALTESLESEMVQIADILRLITIYYIQSDKKKNKDGLLTSTKLVYFH